MKTHELKTWPEYFQAILERRKTFELRKTDRPFEVGDTLFLREFDPHTKEYSGRNLRTQITYILDGAKTAWGPPEDTAILSFSGVFWGPSDETDEHLGEDGK